MDKGHFKVLRLSKNPSSTQSPLYILLPIWRVFIFLLLSALHLPMDLKALEGSLEIRDFNTILDLFSKDLTLSLDNFLLSLMRDLMLEEN